MKTLIKLLLSAALLALAFFASGCSTIQSDIAKTIPAGAYKNISATITGKFSATSFVAEDVTVTPEGKLTGGHVHLRHSNIYVPLVEVDVQAAAPVAVPK